MARRTIVISDVHGCHEEQLELCRVLEVKSGDRLIYVGDLVDRGPDPVAVVRWVRERGDECMLGNHEEKHLRWANHQAVFRATGKKNPMRPFDEKKLREHESLTQADLEFMASLPLFTRFEDGKRTWLVTHAGVPTDKPIEDADPKALIRTRRVDKDTGKYASTNNPREEAPNSVYWSERWRGPESVVHGHIVQERDEPRLDEPVPGIYCAGIDTGCCFGGYLTAAVFTGTGGWPTLVRVKAKAVYYDRNNFHADD